MEPSKKIGRVKEQVGKEHLARRNFVKKWGYLADPELNKFYNQNHVNELMKDQLKLQDLCPYKYTGSGESYFVSKDMYNALVAKCRCGRSRAGIHTIYCLQKEQDRFLNHSETILDKDKLKSSKEQSSAKETEKNMIPETSNAAVGFYSAPKLYQKWELSMKYTSPVYTMPGYRITARPYNAIIIG